MKRKSLVVRSVLAAALMLPAVVVTAGPAQAADVVSQLRVVSHNVDGTQNGRAGRANALDYTVAKIKEWAASAGAAPQVVLLQEICVHQLRSVRAQLEADPRTAGYDFVFAHSHQGDPALGTATAGTDSRYCKYSATAEPITDVGKPIRDADPASQYPVLVDQSYGNAVLVKGTITGTSAGQLYKPADTDGVVRRWPLLCANATIAPFGTSKIKACSVHLATKNVDSDKQVFGIASALHGAAYTGGQEVVVGGDFNTNSGETGLDPLWHLSTTSGAGKGAYVEADEYDKTYFQGQLYQSSCSRTKTVCRTGQYTHRTLDGGTTTKPNRKLDYIFFSDAYQRSGAAANAANANEASGLALDADTLGPIGAPPTGYSDHLLYRGAAKIVIQG